MTATIYSPMQRMLHWLTLVLLVALYAIAWSIDSFESRDTRQMLLTLHQSIGLTVIVLTLWRIVLRRMRPVEAAKLPPWMRRAAVLGHAVLYLLLIALPVTGWLVTSARGGTVSFFWLVQLPGLLATDKATGRQLMEIHETVGLALLAVVAGHALAALYHHYMLRDATLRAMLPGARTA